MLIISIEKGHIFWSTHQEKLKIGKRVPLGVFKKSDVAIFEIFQSKMATSLEF